MQNRALFAAAVPHWEAGQSVLPVAGKLPWMEWKRYQEEQVSRAQLEAWCMDRRSTGICLITGAVSGGVKAIDFDVKAGRSFYQAWIDRMQLHGPRGQAILAKLPTARTGSGGIHRPYRCANPGVNAKLAQIPGTDKDGKPCWLSLIETRANGGLIVLPPSMHPDRHVPYEYLNGHFAALPFLDDAEDALVMQTAQSLSEKREVQRVRRPATTFQKVQSGSVIDDFNAAHDICDMLERYGYRVVRNGTMAVRPGGERPTVQIRDNASWHNNTNDPLEGHWRKPFDVYCEYEHGGRFQDALRGAAAILGRSIQVALPPSPPPPPGQGGPRPQPRPTPPPPFAARQTFVLITDDQAAADQLATFNIPVVVADHAGRDMPEVAAQVEDYDDKVVLFGAYDGYAESLALDLGARCVQTPSDLVETIARGTFDLLALMGLVRSAQPPVFRVKVRA